MATHDGLTSSIYSIISDIRYQINQENIDGSNILCGKSMTINSLFDSGLFIRAYSEGIRTADDFKMYIMGSEVPTKRGIQKINMRTNLYMQWIEMYHK